MRQGHRLCCGIQCGSQCRTLPGSVKKSGDRCANPAPFDCGGKTQAAHHCPQEGWRTGMTEDVAAEAGCQGDQTVIGIPGHLLSGTS